MSVARAQKEIDSKEFMEWFVMDKRDPFSPQREDAHAAQISAAIANANRNKKKRSRPYTIKDFLLRFKRPRVDKDPDQNRIKHNLMMWKQLVWDKKGKKKVDDNGST